MVCSGLDRYGRLNCKDAAPFLVQDALYRHDVSTCVVRDFLLDGSVKGLGCRSVGPLILKVLAAGETIKAIRDEILEQRVVAP